MIFYKLFFNMHYNISTVMITTTPVDNLDIVMESITWQCKYITITPVLNFLPITITLLLIFNCLDVKNIRYEEFVLNIIINNVSVNKPMPGVILHGVQYLLVSSQQLKPRH